MICACTARVGQRLQRGQGQPAGPSELVLEPQAGTGAIHHIRDDTISDWGKQPVNLLAGL